MDLDLTATTEEEQGSVPRWKGLEMVVGHVQNSKVCVASEHGHTLVCQPVVGQVQLLQDAVAFL